MCWSLMKWVNTQQIFSAFEIILRKIWNSNMYMGDVLIIFSMNHTQIQPIRGHKFLTSCHIISCFKMATHEEVARRRQEVREKLKYIPMGE